MTIDEAIAHAREVAEKQRKDNDNCEYKAEYGCEGCADYYSKQCIECAEEHEQLAEWLEELKEYRASVFSGYMTKKMLKEEYNKAVDDFAEKFLLELSESVIWSMLVNCHKDNNFNDTADKIVNYVADEVRNTAEQLKVGDSE